MDKLTLGIITLTVLVSLKGFNDIIFFNRYKFQIEPLEKRDFIRLLSSGFLHVDVSHLLFNMLTLYFFADVLISNLGGISFLIIYFVSLLNGNILTYFYHKKEPHYSAAGASGAVSGVLFAAILLYPNMSLYIMFIPIPIPAYVVGIGYLAYTVFGMKKQLGNIGHSAHLGGAVAGIVICLILLPELIQTRTLLLVLLIVPIIILSIVGKRIN